MTQVGGVGLLGGALVVYALFGSYEIDAFLQNAAKLGPSPIAWMAFGFLIAAAAKLAQFPFQTWLPDAMEAPTPVSALIHAATMVVAGVFLVARFFPFLMFTPDVMLVIALFGAVTAIFAATIGCTQWDIKKVLAYSTVSQLGFMITALGCRALAAGFMHLMTHAWVKACLFLSSGSVIHGMHHEQDMLM